METEIIKSAIILPKDHYAHLAAPTEWWWHVGTLISSDGRKFGFEITVNGSNGSESKGISYAFTQVQITDVNQKKNYQKVASVVPRPLLWAESDPSKPWYVKLQDPGSKTNVIMQSFNSIGHMQITADFIDAKNKIPCKLDLNVLQQGPPLLVWGTGCHPSDDTKSEAAFTKDLSGDQDLMKALNYYYSFTKLRTTGTITINDEQIDVTGLTWMDHEYGSFPNPQGGPVWTFQDAQLDNGIQLSSYTKFGIEPGKGALMQSFVTVLWPDGNSTFHNSVTTPDDPVTLGEGKKRRDYFMTFNVVVPELDTKLTFRSLVEDQLFIDPGPGADVYEGVASCNGTFGGAAVSGSGWIEQSLGTDLS